MSDNDASAIDSTMYITNDGQKIYYGTHETRIYYASTSGGQSYLAFCAEPHKTGYYGTTTVQTTTQYNNAGGNYDKIKLMTYISWVNTSATLTAIEQLFGSIPEYDGSDNMAYAYGHAAIGYLFAGDTDGLSGTALSVITNHVPSSLGSYISSNSTVWQEAQRFTLVAIKPSTIPSGYQNIVWLMPDDTPTPTPVYGNISLVKLDAETRSSTNTGGASFEGISYGLYNYNGSSITIGGNTYAHGQRIISLDLNRSGQYNVSTVPAGTYMIKEDSTNSSYLIDQTPQTFTISTSGETKTVTFYDQPVRGDVKFTKMNSATGEKMANIPFRITSKTTGESHVVVTNSNGVVNTSSSFIQHTNNTNGYDSQSTTNISYAGYGTWFNGQGTATINNSLGALPYDSYVIVELSCEANQQCTDLASQRKEFTISSNNTVVDLGTWNNDCPPPEKHGSIKIYKKDAETDSNSSIGKASLYGITFEIVNSSGSDITYNGVTYGNGQVIKTLTTDSGGEASISFLPEGTYTVREASTNGSYVLNTRPQTVTISTDNETKTVTFYNQPVRGDVKFVKINSATGEPMANIPFRITSKTTGEGHIVVTDGSGRVNTSSSFAQHTNNTNGYDSLTVDNITFGGFGTWFNGRGTAAINNSLGALPYDSYVIVELSCNANSRCTDLASQQKEFTISSHGTVVDLGTWNNNCPPEETRGGIKIVKLDAETRTKNGTGATSVAGMTFEIVNSSGRDITYNGDNYSNGQVIKTLVTDSNGENSISNLPEGTYTVRETSTNGTYILNTTPQTVTISANDVMKTVTFYNQPIRGDVSFIKVNTATDEPMANIPFRITSKTTGESHIVVSNNNGQVDTSSSFAQHTNNTNGYDSLTVETITFGGFGTWFNGQGTAAINNSLGALPYDTYEIVELSCNNNAQCTDIANQKKEFQIRENAQKIDLGTWNNDCPPKEKTIGTTATDASDGDKEIKARPDVTIKDTIEYCLEAGKTYTIKGVLMDKSTGEKLLINNSPIEATITITPPTDCGTTEMNFSFDASSIANKTIVVYEYAYIDDELIVSHTDINDTAQTIHVEQPVRGDVKFTKIDKNSGKTMANIPFRITSKTTGENHIVVTNNEGKINTASSFNLHTNSTNGYDSSELWKIQYHGYGTWFSTEADGFDVSVNNALGALPAGEYEINELNCESNMFCKDVEGSKQAFSITTNNSIVSLSNWENDCLPITITTTATDSADGDKEIIGTKIVEIKDNVKYCVAAGKEYTVKGVLMDKSTGHKLTIGGKTVESSVTFTPDEDCGDVDVVFSFDGSELKETDIVVFEYLYYNDQLIFADDDINNASETVHFIPPSQPAIPDTGMFSGILQNQNESRTIFIVVFICPAILFFAYITKRYMAKRKFGVYTFSFLRKK